jgi:hypothetical protein
MASTETNEVTDLTGSSSVVRPCKKTKSTTTKQSSGEGTPERRARVFRKRPPKAFLDRLSRATTQRYAVEREDLI